MLLLLGAFAAFADDPPPGTVVQRPWLRPCLDSGSVTHEQYEYKCTSAESNVQVYNFYTHNEYLKDAVYRVDRSPVSETTFYAHAVKQSVTVAHPTMLDNSAALVYQRETRKEQPVVVDRGWAYKKKD
ncbi:MAG TPA: hypothetical protein VGQ65_21635 [Thermoanaerobaculia bacterium]|nr:hypothetical protein [Thermoanaerobaculia bacterium]